LPGICPLAEERYLSLVRTHVPEFLATANSLGELWLLVGTDSGFEGTTAVYFQRIDVELIPLLSPAPSTSKALAAFAICTTAPGSAAAPAGPPKGARSTTGNFPYGASTSLKLGRSLAARREATGSAIHAL
jgi:hypothetical protein